MSIRNTVFHWRDLCIFKKIGQLWKSFTSRKFSLTCIRCLEKPEMYFSNKLKWTFCLPIYSIRNWIIIVVQGKDLHEIHTKNEEKSTNVHVFVLLLTGLCYSDKNSCPCSPIKSFWWRQRVRSSWEVWSPTQSSSIYSWNKPIFASS